MSRASAILSPFGAARTRFLAEKSIASENQRAWLEVERLAHGLEANRSPGVIAAAAWELACGNSDLDDDQRGLLAILALATLVAVSRGHSGVSLSPGGAGSLATILSELAADGAASQETWSTRIVAALEADAFRAVVGPPGSVRPLILEGQLLFPHRLFVREVGLAARLVALANRPLERDEASVNQALLDATRGAAPGEASKGVTLTDEQCLAVSLAAAAPLAVIAGGPGTGKTTIVLTLLDVLSRLGGNLGDVALAAPTGKAANRLAASMSRSQEETPPKDSEAGGSAQRLPAASTLHRLLGISRDDAPPLYGPNNPLPARLVIVDESSMVDLELMDALVAALSAEARLVLLGDADQLPSVESGTIFRDLVAASAGSGPFAARVVRLTRSHRMDPNDPRGRNILSVARALNEGRVPPTAAGVDERMAHRRSASAVRFEGVERLGEKSLDAFLERWSSRFAESSAARRAAAGRVYPMENGWIDAASEDELRTLFAELAQARLLAMTNARAEGVDRLNAWLHERWRKTTGLDAGAEFAPSEPIFMTENDYANGLFNGDQGVTLMAAPVGLSPRLMAVFPREDRFLAISLASLGARVRLAHAMTVHKSQGSEFDHVALILPSEDSPLSTREILYTAVTRARRSVTLVGSTEILKAAVVKRVERVSGLSHRLTNPN